VPTLVFGGFAIERLPPPVPHKNTCSTASSKVILRAKQCKKILKMLIENKQYAVANISKHGLHAHSGFCSLDERLPASKNTDYNFMCSMLLNMITRTTYIV
jgi:hypothetical protein